MPLSLIRNTERRAPGMRPLKPKSLTFEASKSSGKVSALLLIPEDARWLFAFAHGAGAGMKHPFLDSMAGILAEHGIGTFRYQFPYTEQGFRRPDPQPILVATVRSAADAARKAGGGLPLIAGGKSMGGRMTSLAAAREPLADVRGIAFLGFPLHAPGKPSLDRADHLQDVTVPMLFLQGTRDALADLPLLKPVCRKLGDRATLHVVEGADHSFRVLKSSGRTDAEIRIELAVAFSAWSRSL